MEVVRLRPRPMAEKSPLLVEGVGAVMLVGELAPLGAEPLAKSTLWLGSAAGVLKAAFCPTQKSHIIHPNTVPALPQLTTDTGETRS